jgi:hypothetical protein
MSPVIRRSKGSVTTPATMPSRGRPEAAWMSVVATWCWLPAAAPPRRTTPFWPVTRPAPFPSSCRPRVHAWMSGRAQARPAAQPSSCTSTQQNKQKKHKNTERQTDRQNKHKRQREEEKVHGKTETAVRFRLIAESGFRATRDSTRTGRWWEPPSRTRRMSA